MINNIIMFCTKCQVFSKLYLLLDKVRLKNKKIKSDKAGFVPGSGPRHPGFPIAWLSWTVFSDSRIFIFL